MEETLLKTLEHAPALLAIIVILFMVGKHLEKRDEAASERTKEFTSTLRDMHADNVEARQKSQSIIERNSTEAANNTNALRAMTEMMKDFLKGR